MSELITESRLEKIMKAGSNAIKLEGASGNLDLIKHTVESGVPVMGHLGLTPQSVHQLGGFKVQGRGKAAEKIIQQAKQLQEAGCFCVVLEAVPNTVAEAITEELIIPTIGIGAGPNTDGQVLVFQDLLGLNKDFKPKFVRNFADGANVFTAALNDYNTQVKSKDFPSINESYES